MYIVVRSRTIDISIAKIYEKVINMIKKDIYNQYLHYSNIHTECTLSGNYRKGNQASKKIESLNAFLKNNFEENKEIIDRLIESSNPGAFLWASNIALDLQYRMEEVVKNIIKISKRKDLGLIAFGAEMQLKMRKIL